MIVSRPRTMHPQSPSLTIGRTVLKESDDLVVLGVTFDSKMTFEKHLRSVSRAALQRLFILTKSWRVFHDRPLLGMCFRGFVLRVLEYCLPGARLPMHTLTTGLSSQWCPVSNWGVFECDIFHRRSVAVLCMLYKMRCNPVHPLNDALPGPYVSARLHAVLWSHMGTLMHSLAAEPCSTAGLLFPSRCPSGTILLTPYSMVWDWRS